MRPHLPRNHGELHFNEKFAKKSAIIQNSFIETQESKQED